MHEVPQLLLPERLTPLEKMMEEIDEDGSGLVEFDEYWEWWMKGVTKIHGRGGWRCRGAGDRAGGDRLAVLAALLDVVERAGRAAFNRIDDDGSGELDREESGCWLRISARPWTRRAWTQ